MAVGQKTQFRASYDRDAEALLSKPKAPHHAEHLPVTRLVRYIQGRTDLDLSFEHASTVLINRKLIISKTKVKLHTSVSNQ